MVFHFPLPLFGEEPAVPPLSPPAPQTETPTQVESIEASRDYVSGKIANFASAIDRFFGGNRHYQESNPSVVQLNLTRVLGYGGSNQFAFATRVNLKLPVTEGKLRLVVETDPENNVVTEAIPGSVVRKDRSVAPKSTGVAARFDTAEESRWHFSTDAGVKLPIPITPFIRARGRYSTPLGEWQLNATESVYWFNTLGVGETSQLDFERIISASILFRASSNATWLMDKQNFDLRQDLTFFHQLSDRTALRYQATTSAVSRPNLHVTDYVLLVFYRYRLHRQWLFFEVSPQWHFPREKNYQPSPTLSMRLELLFDESR